MCTLMQASGKPGYSGGGSVGVRGGADTGGLQLQVQQWLADVLPPSASHLASTWEMTPDNVTTLTTIAEAVRGGCVGRMWV